MKTLVAILALLSFNNIANAQTPTRLCGVEWPPFTYQKDGKIYKGLTFDILSEAFSRIDQPFEALSINWPRCLRLVEQGIYDAVIDNAALKPYIFGKHPTAIYPLAIYVRADWDESEFSWEKMTNKKVGMVRGYDYTPKIKGFKKWHPQYVTNDLQLLKLLKRNRLDYVVLDLFSSKELSEKAGVKIKQLQPTVDSTELFLVFNKDNLALKNRYDEAVGKMIKDGALDRIYRKYLPFGYSDIVGGY